LLYQLFMLGWICPILFGAMMAIAILAWISGFHA
jgi:hypothetical protein